MDDEKVIPPNEISSNQAVLDHSDVERQAPVPNDATPYEKKAMLLNSSMQEIGMGRYQWALFVVTGFGYFADNLWPIVTGLILPAVVNEFEFNAPFIKLGQNIGLLIGAVFWSIGSDIWGRKTSFNFTLLITGIFAVAAGGSPSYTALSSLAAAGSVGVGGNLPVDSAIFLEFVPATHQYLLTVLSIWWAFGQLFGSLIAWPLLSNLSCDPATTSPPSSPGSCTSAENKGWRYFLYTTGGFILLLWAIRFFCFTMHESPKYLMGKGRLEEAVEVVRKVAQANGKESSLVVRDLEVLEEVAEGVEKVLEEVEKGDKGEAVDTILEEVEKGEKAVGGQAAAKEVQSGLQGGVQVENGNGNGKDAQGMLAGLDWGHVKALFATREEAYSTYLLVAIWGLIGFAFPLYNSFVTYFLSTRGVQFGDGSTYTTYRNQVILSAIGVPGSVISGFMVELPFLGRRGTLSIFTALTGVFILASTTSRTSNALLGWNSAYSFTSNIMYGVLYAVTPELFPTKDRGTGNALAAAANRIFGVMAPIIAMYADLSTSVPIYISGSIFVVCGVLALLLPRETRGTAAL